MPLISLADGLEHARAHRYALGAFNVLDSHFLRALFAAAKQERSPFIINIADVDSICQCNTPFNYLFRCFELQCLSRSVV